MPRLTEKFIVDIRMPAQGQAIYRDDDLVGFGLRATARSKAFIVETRVEGKVRRLTIGQHGSMTLDQARTEARKILLNLTAGRANRSKSAPTLHQVLDAYVAQRTLRPNTITNRLEGAFGFKRQPLDRSLRRQISCGAEARGVKLATV